MKKYDFSIQMAQDIIDIDHHSFKSILYSPEELNERLHNNPYYSLYIEYQNEIPVGYVGILEVQTPHYHGAWIDLLAVKKDFENLKIGQSLIKEALKEIKKMGISLSTALVRSDNISSLKTLKKNGYSHENYSYRLLVFGD